MEIILMKPVAGLGEPGQICKVADGYARNYLIPKGLAEPATPAARRRLEKIRAAEEAQRAAQLAAARELARRISETSVTIRARAGEEGKLFGSVTAAQIAEALEVQGILVDRHSVSLEQPIRELGVYTVPIHLAPEVTASLKVWVVEE